MHCNEECAREKEDDVCFDTSSKGLMDGSEATKLQIEITEESILSTDEPAKKKMKTDGADPISTSPLVPQKNLVAEDDLECTMSDLSSCLKNVRGNTLQIRARNGARTVPEGLVKAYVASVNGTKGYGTLKTREGLKERNIFPCVISGQQSQPTGRLIQGIKSSF